MSKTLTCYHCSSTISSSELIESDLAGVRRAFCCPGCMAIAQTIHGEGLEDLAYTAPGLCQKLY